MVPSGLISVIPHACSMYTPWRSSKACISDSGTAEPPHVTLRSVEKSTSFSSAWRSTSMNTVGTPPAMVTFSCSISPHSGSACRKRPGMIRSAPTRPAWCARPHALAWNMGTIGRIRSAELAPIDSAMPAPMACSTVERCEYRTPFGLPVVPLV